MTQMRRFIDKGWVNLYLNTTKIEIKPFEAKQRGIETTKLR